MYVGDGYASDFWYIHIHLFYMYTGGVYNRTGFTPINKKVE